MMLLGGIAVWGGLSQGSGNQADVQGSSFTQEFTLDSAPDGSDAPDTESGAAQVAISDEPPGATPTAGSGTRTNANATTANKVIGPREEVALIAAITSDTQGRVVQPPNGVT